MTDRAYARVYHGLRNLPPNRLPSDLLDRSRFFNALHDANCSQPGYASLVSPGFEAYIAKKQKEPAPTPHRKKTATTPSHIDSRTNAFLAMYGIDPSDIESKVKKDPYITTEQSTILSYKYNPDRDTTILPASDLDAVAYNFLGDLSDLHQYATVLDVNTSLLDASEVSVYQQVTHTPSIVSSDSGYTSSGSVSDLKSKISRPSKIRRFVQIRVWYSGRTSYRRKAFIRLGVKLRRVRHFGLGSHSLVGSRNFRLDIKYGGRWVKQHC